MSKLSVLLKNIVGVLALNEGDKQRLHDEIDAIVPAGLGVALGGNAREAINAVVVPLLQDVLNLSEQRLMGYVENRIAGVSLNAAIPPPLVVPAGIDPDLVAPALETTDAQGAGAVVVGEDEVVIPPAAVEEPAGVVEEPAPVVEEPANVTYDSPPPVHEEQQTEAPPPVVEEPAAVTSEPSGVVEEPAPAVTPLPVAEPERAPPAPTAEDHPNRPDAESFEPLQPPADPASDDDKWRSMGYSFDPVTGEPLR